MYQRILGIVLILMVLNMILNRNTGKKISRDNLKDNWLIYPALFGIGFYGGFIQVGVGFLLMASLYHILRLSLIRVNMHKVFIVLIYTVPALIIFIGTGNINWGYGLCLAAGNALGAWFGVHAAVKGGEKAIRYVLICAILIMSAKLLKIF